MAADPVDPLPDPVPAEEMTDDGKCPHCGAEPCSGYGLAYGGMGVYYYCSNDECEWFYKVQDVDDSEPMDRGKEALRST